MGNRLAAILVMVLIGGVAVVFAGPLTQASQLQDFGSVFTFVVALNVVHTLIVLAYLWRIWLRVEPA